jgi:hypothetical protein
MTWSYVDTRAVSGCTQLTKLIPDVPNYECRCDPGWSQAWKAIPFSSCVISTVTVELIDPDLFSNL